MAIKVTENKFQPKEEFPILMKSRNSGVVVLFTSPAHGVVVKSHASFPIGHYRNDWTFKKFPDEWEPYTGTICLCNE